MLVSEAEVYYTFVPLDAAYFHGANRFFNNRDLLAY